MTIKLYMNGCEYPAEIKTDINVKVEDLLTQLEEGNLLLIEDIKGNINIINMMNVNSIQLIKN